MKFAAGTDTLKKSGKKIVQAAKKFRLINENVSSHAKKRKNEVDCGRGIYVGGVAGGDHGGGGAGGTIVDGIVTRESAGAKNGVPESFKPDRKSDGDVGGRQQKISAGDGRRPAVPNMGGPFDAISGDELDERGVALP